MRAIGRSGRIVPPFGKMVYAIAISRGLASNTPSAIDGYGRGGVPAPTRRHRAAT
jgi:hypothetical protein